MRGGGFAPFAMAPCQCGAGDRAGVVVEADQRIEFMLGGWRIAQRKVHIPRVPGDVFEQAAIALLLRPHRVRPDAGPCCAPADRPRCAARSGVGIGLDHAIGAHPRTAFELPDQRNPGAADMARPGRA